MAIPIIDLFAGPGGLGEGFTSLVDKNGERVFKIVLSIEKDKFAHETLTLRSFLRQFRFNKYPKEYYQFLRQEIEMNELFKMYPKQSEKAKEEAFRFELGNPETHPLLDKRIKDALKGKKDFLLIGGPPCQAYSLVGRARRGEGTGLNKDDERVYLYREYYRILAQHKPLFFIMENVKGLLSSRVDDSLIFNQLLSDLQNPVESYRKLQGSKRIASKIKYKVYSLAKRPRAYDRVDSPLYNNSDFVIRSEDYGIPQTRHRLILLGIRSDYPVEPKILEVVKSKINIQQILNGLPPLRSGLSKGVDDKATWKKTLLHFTQNGVSEQFEPEILRQMKKVVINLKPPSRDRGGVFVPSSPTISYLRNWYLDELIEGVCNHETRSHISEDLLRYLFAAVFGQLNKRSPKLSDFPKSLLPRHRNAQKAVLDNKFTDRFRVQIATEPAKTVTSHISKDGHYYIHPDPSQCRSLTVREAARVQTFPDNYFFCGPRTEQFHQVGNAVPPLLARQIATIVADLLSP